MQDAAVIAVRFALYVDLTVLMGVSLFGLYGARGATPPRHWLPFRAVTATTAAIGLLLSIASLFLLAANMGGTTVSDVDAETLQIVVAETSMGTAWLARVAVLIAALIVSPFSSRLGLALSSGLGAVALATLAWGGHGAATEGAAGWLHLGADIVHLLASALWLGGLAALLMLLFPRRDGDADRARLSHRALAGFAGAGTIAVALIVLTGLVNSWMLVGINRLPALVTTAWGQLLLLKLTLFAVMLALAALNRFRLTPRLDAALETPAEAAALNALRVSLLVEAAAACAVLALVAWLGTLVPPASL